MLREGEQGAETARSLGAAHPRDYEEATSSSAWSEYRRPRGHGSAIDYYKRAVHRTSPQDVLQCEEVWDKITALAPDDKDFFFLIERKVVPVPGRRARRLTPETLYLLLKKPDYDTAIEILKRLLSYEPRTIRRAKDIVECYARSTRRTATEEYIRIPT